MSSKMLNSKIGKWVWAQRIRLLLVAALFLVGFVAGITRSDNISLQNRFQDFFTIFLGLLVEATPFVFIGVVVSVLVALFFSESWFLKYVPGNRIISHAALSILGVFMPVCECGNVPVVRRFLLKGFKSSHAITFLLAAPIINPITIWTTTEAFGFDISIVIIRVLGAFLIANIVGLLFSLIKDDSKVITESFYEEVCNHDHSHDHKNKAHKAMDIFQSEFITVFTMMMVGAAIASAFQTFIPRSIITAIGTSPTLSILAMILLAFVISICANVDAFFARTYLNTFTMGSLVSFMVFGPMIDIKMLTMLKNTFRLWALLLITFLVTVFSVLIGLLVNYFY